MANEIGSKAEKESKRNLNLTLALFAAYRAHHGAARTRVDRNRRVVLVVVAVPRLCAAEPLATYVELLPSEQNTSSTWDGRFHLCRHGRQSHRLPRSRPHRRNLRTRFSTECGIRCSAQVITAGIQSPTFPQLPPSPEYPQLGLRAPPVNTFRLPTSAEDRGALFSSRSATDV